jgi:hypothetical protein
LQYGKYAATFDYCGEDAGRCTQEFTHDLRGNIIGDKKTRTALNTFIDVSKFSRRSNHKCTEITLPHAHLLSHSFAKEMNILVHYGCTIENAAQFSAAGGAAASPVQLDYFLLSEEPQQVTLYYMCRQ